MAMMTTVTILIVLYLHSTLSIFSVGCIIADLVDKSSVGENPGKIDKNGDYPSSVAIL